MKEETKELIKWIKEACEEFVYNSKDFKENLYRDKTYDEVVTFLDSLPEIESHLCRGGYIQDKNGTPCCDGDQIINPSLLDGAKELGSLYWSKSDCRFFFKKEDKCYSLAVGYNGFEKVK